MSKYKAVTSDLDGTLFNKEMLVSEENLIAIEKIAKLGVEFVPTTGRTLAEISPSLLENPNIRYVIYSNGSAIWDKEKNTHTRACMSGEVANSILDLLSSYEVHITLRAGGKTYINKETQTKEMREYNRVSYYHGIVLDSHAEKIDNYEEFMRGLDEVEVFSVFFHSDEEYAECLAKLSKREDVIYATTLKHNCEIFSKDSGKANAIKSLAKLISATTDEIISVGDSDNDMTMIRTAGLGLATANAHEKLKLAADRVICSNEEHIADYILRNIL